MLNTYCSDNQETFLWLVRLGIGTSKNPQISKDIDWAAMKALADKQGLSAIILDALNAGGSNLTDGMPLELKLEWIGEVLQVYEGRYAQYKKAIGSLAGFYNKHGLKMMVLKGYACGIDWPRPEHRPYGDIDIWQFGKQKEADAALGSWLKDKGSRSGIDNSHHHHTVFDWHGFTVENHYDFVNVHAERSSREMEKVFKELGQDDSNYVELNGVKVYLPSSNLHSLFLIRHMVGHFAAAEISLRQVLDWAFFVETHTKEIDWLWLRELLEKYHMLTFFNCINAICVGDLGFDVKIFPNVQFDFVLKNKVLADILAPVYTAAEPRSFFKRVVFKYRRWQGNAWKQRYAIMKAVGKCSGRVYGLSFLKPASI